MQVSFFLRRFAFSGIKYTKNHEWVQYIPDQKKARVGITHYAQEQLGEIIFVEMPAIGKQVNASDTVVVVESVKIAADVYTPLAGQVSAINSAVVSEPKLINTEPENSWLFELIVPSAPTGLLNAQDYKKHVESVAH